MKKRKVGIITPPKVIEAINASGAKEVVLLFEISHREQAKGSRENNQGAIQGRKEGPYHNPNKKG